MLLLQPQIIQQITKSKFYAINHLLHNPTHNGYQIVHNFLHKYILKISLRQNIHCLQNKKNFYYKTSLLNLPLLLIIQSKTPQRGIGSVKNKKIPTYSMVISVFYDTKPTSKINPKHKSQLQQEIQFVFNRQCQMSWISNQAKVCHHIYIFYNNYFLIRNKQKHQTQQHIQIPKKQKKYPKAKLNTIITYKYGQQNTNTITLLLCRFNKLQNQKEIL
eukprot:TRINITY_DN8638_c0_g1_i1.p3 TRINITY_DN8638_c0_g1~~TRINITY_DN8638_c0_g1_i1.p3  ORF type:complete len:244 (+),score=-18.65 TRINITY_DN8638_c0_g1_i1:83-733(+)